MLSGDSLLEAFDLPQAFARGVVCPRNDSLQDSPPARNLVHFLAETSVPLSSHTGSRCAASASHFEFLQRRLAIELFESF